MRIFLRDCITEIRETHYSMIKAKYKTTDDMNNNLQELKGKIKQISSKYQKLL